jgi:hypothetical protein
MSKASVKLGDAKERRRILGRIRRLKPRHELIAQSIDARNQLNITQALVGNPYND